MNDRRCGLGERLLAGETLIGTFANLGSAIAAEICGSAGFDWVLVDLEHGSGTETELPAQLQAIASTEANGLVRVESHDRSRIVRALDAGAAGVMVPRVDSAEQAEAVVAATRYPPAGTRGLALMNRGAAFGAHREHLTEANEKVLVIAQVETLGGLASIDAIAAVDGVDVLFVGPSDLSNALGCFGRFDAPAYADAVRAIGEVCRASGKTAGVLAGTPADAERYLDAGYRFVGVSGDGGFVARAGADVVSKLRSLTVPRTVGS